MTSKQQDRGPGVGRDRRLAAGLHGGRCRARRCYRYGHLGADAIAFETTLGTG